MRRFSLFHSFAVIGLFFLLTFAQGGSRPLTAEEPRLVRTGYSITTLSEVDIHDAEVATKIWFDQIAREDNHNFVFESRVFHSLEEIKTAFIQKTIDTIVISPMELIKLRDDGIPLIPRMQSVIGGSDLQEMIVIVRDDSAFFNLTNLKNLDLIISNRGIGEIPQLWLDTELAKLGLPTIYRFFHSVKEEKKVNNVVLPIFFKQAQVGMVSQEGFETMCELNPQIGKKVRIIRKSMPLARGYVAFHRDFDADSREKLTTAAKKLHKSTKGKQVLTLFKVDQVVDFTQENLSTTEALLRENLKLRGQPLSHPGKPPKK